MCSIVTVTSTALSTIGCWICGTVAAPSVCYRPGLAGESLQEVPLCVARAHHPPVERRAAIWHHSMPAASCPCARTTDSSTGTSPAVPPAAAARTWALRSPAQRRLQDLHQLVHQQRHKNVDNLHNGSESRPPAPRCAAGPALAAPPALPGWQVVSRRALRLTG